MLTPSAARVSRCSRGSAAAPAAAQSTNAMTPAKAAKATYPTRRAPTTGQGAVVAESALEEMSSGTTGAVAPIPNANAPSIGCPSAEMTRQVTTYAPSLRLPGRRQLIVWPETVGSGVVTVVPPPLSRWIPPSTRFTDSLKVIVIWVGELSRRCPFDGSVLSSSACAEPGAASISTSTTAATRATPARRRKVIEVVIADTQALVSSRSRLLVPPVATGTGRPRRQTSRAVSSETTSATPAISVADVDPEPLSSAGVAAVGVVAASVGDAVPDPVSDPGALPDSDPGAVRVSVGAGCSASTDLSAETSFQFTTVPSE